MYSKCLFAAFIVRFNNTENAWFRAFFFYTQMITKLLNPSLQKVILCVELKKKKTGKRRLNWEKRKKVLNALKVFVNNLLDTIQEETTGNEVRERFKKKYMKKIPKIQSKLLLFYRETAEQPAAAQLSD